MTDDSGCPLDRLFGVYGHVKPGEKISGVDEALARKGGMRAFFAPGVSYKDFQEGRFAKILLVCDSNAERRAEVRRILADTVFNCYMAGSFQDAVSNIEFLGKCHYALLGDAFPREHEGELEPLTDLLHDSIIEKCPTARVFAYQGSTELVRPYAGIIHAGSTPLDIARVLITDSER